MSDRPSFNVDFSIFFCRNFYVWVGSCVCACQCGRFMFPMFDCVGGEWDPCPSVAANVASLYCPRLTDHCYLCPPPILLLSSYHPAQPLHLHQPLHPPNPTSMIIWSTFTCNIFCLVCLQWASSIGVGWRQAGWRLIWYLYLLAPVRQVALHCALLYSRLSLGLLVQGLAEMHLDRTQINEIYYPQIAVKGQRS